MARKPKPQAPVIPDQTTPERLEQSQEATNTLALANSIADAEKAEVLSFGEAIGAMRTGMFYETVSEGVMLAAFEKARKSKAYKNIKNPKTEMYFSSLEEFCEVAFGKTYRRLQQVTANRNLVGQDAFEQAEKLGLRQIDYNAIKALPAPEQELVRRAVEEAQSRDEVLDVLQELAGRFAKTEASLSKKLEEAKEDAKAKEEVLSKKSDIINKLQTERAKAQQRIARETPDETIADLRQDATVIANEVLGMVRGNFRHALQTVSEQSDEHLFLAGLVGEVAVTLAMLREEFNLPDVSDARELELIRETAKWAPNAQTSAEPTQDPEDAAEAQE